MVPRNSRIRKPVQESLTQLGSPELGDQVSWMCWRVGPVTEKEKLLCGKVLGAGTACCLK